MRWNVKEGNENREIEKIRKIEYKEREDHENEWSVKKKENKDQRN